MGRYESLVNTTVNLGADNITTLGTLTFQQFKPVDLEVRDNVKAACTSLPSALDADCVGACR